MAEDMFTPMHHSCLHQAWRWRLTSTWQGEMCLSLCSVVCVRSHRLLEYPPHFVNKFLGSNLSSYDFCFVNNFIVHAGPLVRRQLFVYYLSYGADS